MMMMMLCTYDEEYDDGENASRLQITGHRWGHILHHLRGRRQGDFIIIIIITFIFDPKIMVQVTQKGGSQDNEIRTLTKGDYFGEQVNNDDFPLENDWW